MYPEAVLGLEVFHMYPRHIPQYFDNEHLQLHLLAAMMYELVNPNPLAVLQPLLEFRQIRVLRVFGGDDDAGILVVLVLAELLPDVVEAEHAMQQLHNRIDVLVRCLELEGFQHAVGNALLLREDGLLHEEVGDHEHTVEVHAREVPLELAVRPPEGLLDRLGVVVLQGRDDLAEELQDGEGSLLVDLDQVRDLLEQLFEVLLVVVVFDRQTHHVKEKADLESRQGFVPVIST